MPAPDPFVQDQLAYAHVAPEVTGVPEVTKEQVVEAADSASYIEDEKKSPHGAHQQVEETDIPVGDGRLPTDEELETLVRVPAPVPIRAFAVAVCELAERFSYYGCSNAFTNFIQQPRPPYNVGGWTGANRTSGGVTGALGKGQKAAYGLVTFLSFWMYATPIPGSIIADSYLGRYNTIIIALIIATIGHILLIICSIPQVMDNVQGAYACMIIALVVMGIGTGFFKSNIGPLICEQVPTNHMFVSTDKKGQKVLVDPGLTISNIFMFFYWMINIGAITGQVGMSFAEKYVGFILEFSLPTIVFLVCFPILLFFKKSYIRNPPSGSVIPNAFRIFFFCLKPTLSWNPVKTYKLMKADTFWAYGKPSSIPVESRPKWMTFDDIFVDEIRRSCKAVQVFALLPLYQLAYNQMSSNLTSQASSMQLHGTPNQIVGNLDPLAILILVPILDRLVYPFLRRRLGWRVSVLQRMAVGYQVAALSMVYACIVQLYIYRQSPCGDMATTCPTKVNMNVWIQSGSYILVAMSELLVNVPAYEFAYTKAPKSMKSFVMSIQLFMSAISSALGEAFSPISSDPYLVKNYAAVAGICSGAGILFVFFFFNLDKEEEQLNNLSAAVEERNQVVEAKKIAQKHEL